MPAGGMRSGRRTGDEGVKEDRLNDFGLSVDYLKTGVFPESKELLSESFA